MSAKSATSRDRRAQRSRAAIVSAFNEMLLDGAEAQLDVRRVCARAGVGRSTFYLHFEGMDALFKVSITPLFDALAAACLQDDPRPGLTALLGHIWSKRRLVRQFYVGRRAGTMIDLLSISFERALANGGLRQSVPDSTWRLKIVMVAAGVTAVFDEWLSGRLSASVDDIASLLWNGAQSALAAAPVGARG